MTETIRDKRVACYDCNKITKPIFSNDEAELEAYYHNAKHGHNTAVLNEDGSTYIEFRDLPNPEKLIRAIH